MKSALAFVALAAVGVAAAAAVGEEPVAEEVEGRGAAARLADVAASLPAPPRPAFTVGRPHRLPSGENATRYASVARAVTARSAPTGASRPVAALPPQTEEGTANVVVVLDERRTAAGLWVRVRLAVLPNGRTGWVPRAALGGYVFVHTRLVVDRERLSATLLDRGRPVFRAPVGVGVPASPTPAGEFYVRVKLAGFGDPFYGPVAFGTNARSPVLTDWPGGGYIGIHGTNRPDLVPGRVSHGCIRFRNADIVALSRLMPVGTPVTIR